jgi:hemerythrin
MKLFEWQNNYNTDILEIDNQHKNLVRIINKFHDAMLIGKEKEILSVIVQQLFDYIKIHFSTEENYMVEFNFTDYEQHKKEHDDFRYKIFEVQRDFLDDKIALSSDLFLYLKNWLINHMLGVDKKYIVLFKENGLK